MARHAEIRSDAIQAALAVEVPRLLTERHVAGVSIALISDRTMVLAVGYGLRNSVTGEPITPQTLFEAYSLTKPLVAYRALCLARNGLLDLDRPLDDYLATPYLEHDPRAGRITARTVLAHTSGLPDDETERRITFTPGARWSYSTQGYFVLQQVLERITAARFDETMQRHLLDPLGMAASSFVWEDRLDAVMAQGHTTHGRPAADRQIRVADADSLLTTAADYATFVVACLWPEGDAATDHPGRLMMRPHVRVTEQVSWGLGWGIAEMDDGAWLWHMGGGSGAPFQNFVWVSAAHGMGMVILTNSANGGTIFEPLVRGITGRSFAVFNFVRDYFYS
jgi:CubicO group peptidase (beta-lactamase class C family)